MSEKLDKQVLVVAGIPSNKKVIKFKDDDTWYDVSEKVQGYDLEKYGIVAGATVDVTFDEKKQVVFLKAKKGASKPKEEKKEAPKEEAKVVEGKTETLVIAGVAKNKKVVKFKDRDGWSQISSELQELDYDTVGYKSGKTVLVTFDDKGVITSMAVEVTPEPAPEASKSSSKGSYSNDINANSIEAQVAWKGAVEVVVALINQGMLTENPSTKLTELTKVGILAISDR